MSDNYSLIIKNGSCYINGKLIKSDIGLYENQIKRGKRCIIVDSNLFLAYDNNNSKGYLRYGYDGIFANTGEYCTSIVDPTRWEKIKEMLSKAKNLVSIVPTYITERETLNVELTENLGVMETFEKYLDNFDDINDKRKKDLIDFGKEIITEYEMENE